jgi:hypothetical protein
MPSAASYPALCAWLPFSDEGITAYYIQFLIEVSPFVLIVIYANIGILSCIGKI